MTTNSSIIDTYPSFLQAVRAERPTTIEEWLRCWTKKYMVHWPKLYEEGFALRCESDILAADSWHMMTAAPNDDWLAWCRENRAWLAAEFLRTVDSGESIRPFMTFFTP